MAWIKHGTGRKLFEDYAKAKRFDPLNHENWYLQSKTKIKLLKVFLVLLSSSVSYLFPLSYFLSNFHFKGAPGVLRFYSNSVAKALIDLFPDVTFDKSRLLSMYSPFLLSFSSSTSSHPCSVSWKKPESRRDFLEKYARGCGFDPLVAENWYMPPVVIEKNGETQWKLATMKVIFLPFSVPFLLVSFHPLLSIDSHVLFRASDLCSRIIPTALQRLCSTSSRTLV